MRRQHTGRALAFAIGVVACLVGLWLLSLQKDGEVVDAKEDAAISENKADAGEKSLEALCDSGIRSACDAAEELRDLPDPDDPELQNDEVQDPEVQEPEVQDGETQDPERDNADPNDPDANDPERQDEESQDPEVNDPDPDDPESQDPEVQDPESDDPEPNDPDPNDFGAFDTTDNCTPLDGQYVTDVDLSWDAATSTLTITCTTTPLPEAVVRSRSGSSHPPTFKVKTPGGPDALSLQPLVLLARLPVRMSLALRL